MQISAPLPIFYLPENLWSLFTRPGRELTVRVLQIEGKLLYLELGGYKFQARLGGTLNPEDLKSGEIIKVKVINSEGPIVLQIVGSEKEGASTKLLYLLARERPQEENTNLSSLTKEFALISELFKTIVRKEDKREGIYKDLEEQLGKTIKFIQPHFEEDGLFIPFIFGDEKSWGYLEIKPEKKGEKVQLFILRIFLTYLGLLEAFFTYSDKSMEIDLYFTENKALDFAKVFYKDLREELYFSHPNVIIHFNKKRVEPGFFLQKIG